MAIKKADLVDALLHAGLPKQTATDMVVAVFDNIAHALENNETVKISGFGSFELRDKNARPGRNPKTGEVVDIASRRVVTFSAGPKLKNRLNENPPDQLEDEE